MDINIKIPDDVLYIIDILENNNFEAYAVGGCVRDSLSGKEPHDWDICTSALPEQTMKCFESHHIIETGLKHGTVTLMLNHEPFEITTYRVDGKYKDNRRPENVKFVSVLKRDLARRDFTVNAMAYNPKTGLIDYYGGRQDLTERKIKCVGNADKRFNEDALRIMRALRFASVFGFSIEAGTSESMRKNKKLLHNIAAERIAVEFNKLILGDGANDILSKHQEIITEIIPELIFSADINAAPKDLVIRLALLFDDYEKAKKALSRLKYDNDTSRAAAQLVLYYGEEIKPERTHIKRWLNKIGEERFRQLITIKKPDIEILNLLNEIIEHKQCFLLKDLAVNGSDLIEEKIASGVQIGVVLNKLLDMVINDEAENNKNILLEIARKQI